MIVMDSKARRTVDIIAKVADDGLIISPAKIV